MMDIIVCDDMLVESKKLAELLREANNDAKTLVFSKAEDVLEYMSGGGKADICFLDILMPGTNGITLAQKLRSIGYNNEIVFLTSSNHFAAESYSVGAFSYILKPPTLESIKKLLSRLEEKENNKKEGFFVRSNKASAFIQYCDIAYVEANQRKTLIKLMDNLEIMSNKTFSETASILLANHNFVQSHRSYIVNMNHISQILKQDIIMENNAQIPLSKNFATLKKTYFQWILTE